MLDHLDRLEAEAIYTLRECASQFERSVLLFSGGKDSLCLLRLSEKAFRPGAFPYPVLHIDTGHNFAETLEFRDRTMARLGEKLIVRTVEDSIRAGKAQDEKGPYPSRNRQQSVTLLDTLEEFKFQAAIGGARRDEEKARAKERFFSFRDEFGAWDPKNQRPELWNLFNGKIREGQGMRVFPLSNWTELDVWQYLERESMEVPSLYFTHRRKCVRRRDGTWLPLSPFISPPPEDVIEEHAVRFRTVGDMTCTSPVFTEAATIPEIIREIRLSRTTERGSRADDRRGDTAMEDRKKEGYF
jgi:sulfate adenylyltransferase subunit 2